LKRALYPIIGAVIAVIAFVIFSATVNGSFAGFGQDKSALARQTVQTYWFDIGHGKINQAYGMLTSGNQAARPLKYYEQDMFGFLTHVAAVKATVGKPAINGSEATVPVSLNSPLTSQGLHAYQHLYWENGHWRISDTNGGLSSTK
jgi:hypothetical protein